MNKFTPFLLMLPLLVGCKTTYEYHEYKGEKIVLDYVEDGNLVESNISELASFVQAEKSFIYLLALPNCSSCNNVKNSLKAYSQGNHCNTYWLNIKNVLDNKEDMNTLKTATTGYYQWGENESYPLVYFFFKGDVAFRCGETDTTTFINNYVEVAPKS